VPDHRRQEEDATSALRVPTEGERVVKAGILGAALGAILALLGRRR
jgi:hypothetical protein